MRMIITGYSYQKFILKNPKKGEIMCWDLFGSLYLFQEVQTLNICGSKGCGGGSFVGWVHFSGSLWALVLKSLTISLFYDWSSCLLSCHIMRSSSFLRSLARLVDNLSPVVYCSILSLEVWFLLNKERKKEF